MQRQQKTEKQPAKMPHWLVTLLFVLIGLLVALLLVMLTGKKAVTQTSDSSAVPAAYPLTLLA